MGSGEEIHSTGKATKNSTRGERPGMRVLKDLPVKDAQDVTCGWTAGASTTLQGQECLVFYLGH